MPPEFPADRLLVTEVFTPSGNWSSYPPHKHDVHNPPDEVDLETYYYKIDKPEGWAIQRVYTNDRRIDETIVVQRRARPGARGLSPSSRRTGIPSITSTHSSDQRDRWPRRYRPGLRFGPRHVDVEGSEMPVVK